LTLAKRFFKATPTEKCYELLGTFLKNLKNLNFPRSYLINIDRFRGRFKVLSLTMTMI
jgi:hypothetical protein